MHQHCEVVRRTVHVVNLGELSSGKISALCIHPVNLAVTCLTDLFLLTKVPKILRVRDSADPAAEEFSYPVSFDIRDLVPLEDVMDEMKLGPNG